MVDRYRAMTRKAEAARKNGVVYTPQWVVELILETVFGYQRFDANSVVLDPACGDGAFLEPLVEYVIAWASKHSMDPQQTSELLASSVVGRDIDEEALTKCRTRLSTVAEREGIQPPEWDLLCEDSLLDVNRAFKDATRFSHIIGNPPYIRIQDLQASTRRELQSKYSYCQSGSTDIFLAFFELGQTLLANPGVLAFITSRSYFDSAAAQEFRRSVVNSNALLKVIDFGASQVFPEVSTYTAITVLGNSPDSTSKVETCRMDAETRSREWESIQNRSQFREKRWHLLRDSDAAFVREVENRGPSLGKICSIRVGLATLRDNIYVNRLVSPIEELQESAECEIETKTGEIRPIESAALRRIVKVSKLQKPNEDQRLAIIFPYESVAGQVVPWSESSQAQFPKAMEILSEQRHVLGERGHVVRTWFEYGSTQGLATLFGRKLLVPSMTKDGTLHAWTKEAWTFYSGYGIFFDGDIIELGRRLEQNDFRRYARLVGRTLRGGWFSMTTSSLSPFSLRAEEWSTLGVDSSQLSTQSTLGI